MPWDGFGRARDPDASPGTWLPNADRWVMVATVAAAAAILVSIAMSSGKHGGASAAPSGAPRVLRTAVAPTSTTAVTATSVARAPTTVPARPVAPATTAPPAHLTQASGPDPSLVSALPAQWALGAGWAATAPTGAAGSLSTGGQCPTEPVPVAQGGASLAATLDDAGEQASLTVTLYRLATPAQAGQEQAFTSSPDVVPCLDAFAAHGSLRYPWLGELAGQPVASGAQVRVHAPGDAELLTVAADVNPSPQSAYWAFVHEYVGRYEALTVVSWPSNAPLSTSGLQHVVDAVGASLTTIAAASP